MGSAVIAVMMDPSSVDVQGVDRGSAREDALTPLTIGKSIPAPGVRGERLRTEGGSGQAREQTHHNELRRTLEKGVVAFRIASFAWMLAFNFVTEQFRSVILAALALGAAAVWTAWLATRPGRQ